MRTPHFFAIESVADTIAGTMGEGMVMDTVEKLDAIEEIKKLKARYFRFVDTRQWDSLRALFTPDAQFDAEASGLGRIADLDAFIDGARTNLTGCTSVHHGHCPEIEITSLTAASGIWAMEDMLCWEAGPSGSERAVHGFGHYFEDYRKIDGEWKIVRW